MILDQNGNILTTNNRKRNISLFINLDLSSALMHRAFIFVPHQLCLMLT
ncbi:hypothetical protein LAA29_70080 [Leuconostoc carnosum]|nr:hypothetical protein LAA29_70080 [Leuconostoc carnosum]